MSVSVNPVNVASVERAADLEVLKRATEAIEAQLQQPGRPQEVAVAKLKDLAKNVNEIASLFSIQARFDVHKETKDIMVRVMNTQTNKVIREIPPKQILDMVAKFMELLGILVDEKA